MTSEALHLALQDSGIDALKKGAEAGFQVIKTRKKSVKPRGFNQNSTSERFESTISILALGRQVPVKPFWQWLVRWKLLSKKKYRGYCLCGQR